MPLVEEEIAVVADGMADFEAMVADVADFADFEMDFVAAVVVAASMTRIKKKNT